MIPRVEAAFAQHELTFVQWTVLVALRDGVAHTASELCREISHDSGALTRVIDQLAQRDLIKRSRNGDDRRSFDLALTEVGRRAVESMMPAVVNCLNGAVARFTAEELNELTRLLTKLVDGLSHAAAPRPIDDTVK